VHRVLSIGDWSGALEFHPSRSQDVTCATESRGKKTGRPEATVDRPEGQKTRRESGRLESQVDQKTQSEGSDACNSHVSG